MIEAVATIQAIWAQDPPYDIPGATWPIRLARTVSPDYGVGFMPKPFQKGGPSIHVSARSADSQGVTVAAARGRGVISANFVAHRVIAGHWRGMADGMEKAGRPVDGSELARRAQLRHRRQRCRGPGPRRRRPKAPHGTITTTSAALAKRAGLGATMTPREDMDPATATPEDMIEACVIAGSPATVLDRLVALREEVGPFGHLLMAGPRLVGRERGVGSGDDEAAGAGGDAEAAATCGGDRQGGGVTGCPPLLTFGGPRRPPTGLRVHGPAASSAGRRWYFRVLTPGAELKR